MDFKRIEVIFLCAFLTLNVFLLVTFSKGNSKEVLDGSTGAAVQLESQLQQDKISYTHGKKISNEKLAGYYLSSETTIFEGQNYLRSGQVGPGEVAKTKKPKEDILSFLSEDQRVFQSQDYQYLLSDDMDEGKIVMAQGYEDLPFYDESSQLVLEATKNDSQSISLGKFSQTHIDNVEPLREKQEAISEKDALETLYLANKIPVGGQITDCLLAYTKIFTVRGKNVYIPAWFVWIKDSKENVKVERVNGFSNAIFSTNASDVKEIGF